MKSLLLFAVMAVSSIHAVAQDYTQINAEYLDIASFENIDKKSLNSQISGLVDLFSNEVVIKEMRESLLYMSEFKGESGLYEFSNRYFDGDMSGTKNVSKLILTDLEYEKLNWGKAELSKPQKWVRAFYHAGKIELLNRFLSHQEVQVKAETTNLSEAKSELVWKTFLSNPLYELVELSFDESVNLRSLLLNDRGEVKEIFKAQIGLEKFIDTYDLKTAAEVKRWIHGIELTLNESQIRSLGWPIEFPYLGDKGGLLKKSRSLKLRKMKGMTVISTERSVRKGMKR